MTATGKASQVIAAICAHCDLMTTTGPTLPVAYPEGMYPGGKTFTPPTNLKYLRVQLFKNVPMWQGLTSGVMDQGLLQVSVVWPKSQGLIAQTNVVQQVKDHFAKNTFMINGSTRVQVYGEPWEGPEVPEENVSALPVTIPWLA